MGRSKALLPAGAGGPTFVRRLAAALRDGGIADLLIVGRSDDLPLRAEVETLGVGVRYVENHRAEDGQISSIVAAVNAVDRPGVAGLLIVPVDLPLLTARTVAVLLDAFARGTQPIARASQRGRHGHPVVFAPTVFDELRQADPGIGARVVLRAHASSILEVEVEDEGAFSDVDDPDDYARLFGTRP
jgi:molybdenum cofactor cytidylyltransferase